MEPFNCTDYCVKHNQHAWHANTKGLGECPQENIETKCSEVVESEDISESKH